MAGTWNEGLEKALLLALLDPLSNFSRAQFEEASGKIGGPGGNACRQRFYKLRKEAEALASGSGDLPTTPLAKNASSKAGRSKKTATSARKRKNAEALAEGDDDDNNREEQTQIQPPSKKVKQDETNVKEETQPTASDLTGAGNAIYETVDAETSGSENEIA